MDQSPKARLVPGCIDNTMPNYDFTCQSCKHEFTANVPIAKRDDPVQCPECGKDKCNRAVTAVQVSYSGFKDMYTRSSSGWTDVLKRIKKGSGRGNTIRTK